MIGPGSDKNATQFFLLSGRLDLVLLRLQLLLLLHLLLVLKEMPQTGDKSTEQCCHYGSYNQNDEMSLSHTKEASSFHFPFLNLGC